MDNPETEPEGPGEDRAAAAPDPVDTGGVPRGTDADTPAQPSGDTPTRPGAGLRWGLIVAALLAVVAVVAAIVGLVRWVGADSGASDPRAEIIDDASQAVLNLYTFDPADTDSYLEDITSSVTGPMAEQIAEYGEDMRAQAVETGLEVRPRVHSITLSEYAEGSDEASVLTMMTADMIYEGQRVTIRRQAVAMDLKKVDGVWKVAETAPLFMGDEMLPGYAPGADAPDQDAPASEGPN